MFGGLNFKLCFCQTGTGLSLPGKFWTWCRTRAKFFEFITSVPGKLHCTLEKVTNCPGQSQVTDIGPGGRKQDFHLRKSVRLKCMIMGNSVKPFP